MLTRLVTVLAVLGVAVGGATASADPARPDGTDIAGIAGIGDPYFPEDGNAGIDVRSYAVHDTYLFDGRLSGTTTLTVRATQRLTAFDLDFLLPVSHVRLSTGGSAFSRPDGHELRITPDHAIAAGTTFTATVRYAGRPSRFHYAGESNWVATSQEAEAVNEPHMAPWWFPSNDHPLDKARMDLRVTVPAGKRVVSNGRLLDVRRTAHRTTWHWGGGGPMATYLAFFVAGRFQVAHGRSHHLPYYLAVSRGLPAAQRHVAMQVLHRTPKVVAWLERQAGPYPFSRTGGVVTALDPGFALENQTRPVYPRQVFTTLLVHELAHQWFGDSVSVHHWRDVWLNEGFATYMEHRWSEDHGGPSTTRWLHQTYASIDGQDAFWDLVVADPGAQRIFDFPVYQRGAMTLAALRVRIGSHDLDRVLHRWAAEHRNGNGTTTAFEALAEQVSGRDLTSFFDAWLHTSTRPADTAANGL